MAKKFAIICFIALTFGVVGKTFLNSRAIIEKYGLKYRVVRVIDGDTFQAEALSGAPKEFIVRVKYIDAPEQAQSPGIRATGHLHLLIGESNWQVRLKNLEEDRYGRILAEVCLPDQQGCADLATLMIANGWAFAYDKYLPEHRYNLKTAQSSAQDLQVGMWSEHEDVVPPWIFRQQN